MHGLGSIVLNISCLRVFCMDCKGAKKGRWYFNETLPQKRKKYSQETIDLVANFYQDDKFSYQMSGKKTMPVLEISSKAKPPSIMQPA